MCIRDSQIQWPTFPLTSFRKAWLQRSTVADGRFQSLEQSWDIFQRNWQIISQGTLTTLREIWLLPIAVRLTWRKSYLLSPLYVSYDVCSDTWTTFCHKCNWPSVENKYRKRYSTVLESFVSSVCLTAPNQHMIKPDARRLEKCHLGESCSKKEGRLNN